MRYIIITFFSILFLNACQTKNKNDIDVVAKNVDTTISPDEDFFLFAVGKWIKENPIPNAYSNWGIGNLVQEQIWKQLKEINENEAKKETKIGNFYKAAMDSISIEKQGIKALEKELNWISSIQNMEQLAEITAYLHQISVPVFFDFGIYQDLVNSEKNIIYLYQGGLGLPNRDYYFNYDNVTQKIRNEYKNNFITSLLNETIKENEAYSTAQVLKVYQLEENLAKNSRKLEELRDTYANYNKKSIQDLIKITPNFNWKLYFKKLNIKDIDSIIVGQPEFFVAFNQQIKTQDLNTIKDYLKFMLINSYATYLNKEIDQTEFNFYSKLIKGKKEQLPRWKRALIWEEDAMGEELGKVYVKENFSKATKERYLNIVKNVVKAYEIRIKNLDWMSQETKIKAIEKLNKITYKVGYPDKWKDFSELKITQHSLVENQKNASLFWFNDNVKKLHLPVDRTEWSMTPQTYNAYYNPSNNEIVLPAAIFAIPGFKDEEIDDAVVYGYAGASTIGHEITHGFDDEGRQFDEKGNLKNWWSKEDETKFNEKTKKYINYFNNLVVLDTMKANGEATLGENIADLGGIAIGLDAFKQTKQYKENKQIAGYTPLQRYFFGYTLGWMMHMRKEELANRILTDVHAPYFLRVNAPFANTDDFYKAFNIKTNSKMYIAPENRIKIW
jgi:putative endopeptidase